MSTFPFSPTIGDSLTFSGTFYCAVTFSDWENPSGEDVSLWNMTEPSKFIAINCCPLRIILQTCLEIYSDTEGNQWLPITEYEECITFILMTYNEMNLQNRTRGVQPLSPVSPGGHHLLFGGTSWEGLILQLSSVEQKLPCKHSGNHLWARNES